MRVLFGVGLALLVQSSGALADGISLAGSLWQCNRASDKSRFVITFYPGGGVGGGEVQDGEVSPYVYDATNRKEREWPGRWEQIGQSFTWSFPDQHMTIAGTIRVVGRSERLKGIEAAAGTKAAVRCSRLSKLPKMGEGLVIPKDGRFLDLDGDEGELKVPAGISLQPAGP
jgi:hypothetical protein